MGHLMGLDTHCLYTSLFKPVTHTSLQEASIGRTMTTNGGYSTRGIVGLDTHLSTHCGFCSASHGVGTHVLMGLDTHSCETMVVLCKFFLEALHTWTYTTNWKCYPPMGPRLYTPLSFFARLERI